MWNTEKDFQDHLINLLEMSREEIITDFVPFGFVNLSVDIKSLFKNIEEWRELKILYYGQSSRYIQNLWKGIGKVRIMQKLSQIYLTETDFSILNILSLPEKDFEDLPTEIQRIVIELVSVELVNSANFYWKSEKKEDS